MKRALLVSGLIQMLFLVGFLINSYFFPAESCRLYGDCTGRALGISFIAIPLGVAALVNLIGVKLFARLPRGRILAWLVITWIYLAYWLLPILLYAVI